MTKALLIVAALFALAPPAPVARARQEQQQQPAGQAAPGADDPGAVMKGLRNRLLTSKPSEVGLEGEDAKAKVWGVLLEFGFPEGTATLVSLRDGTSSLYTSTGGGILGGYTARPEARRCVAQAERHLARMKATKSFPYPAPRRVKFYLLTQGGVYAAEAGMDEAAGGRHPLSPLFYAGNEVLTKLREAHERAQPPPRP